MERHCSKQAGETLRRCMQTQTELKSSRGVRHEAAGNIACASIPQLATGAITNCIALCFHQTGRFVSSSDSKMQRTHKEEH